MFLICSPSITTASLLVYKKDESGMQARLPRFPKFLSAPRNHYRNNKKNERVHLIWHIVFFITNTLKRKILFRV